MKHTIFALASAQGRAGVSVVRLSGPEAGAAVRRLAGPDLKPRHATLAALAYEDEVLDQALVLWFPKPHSFTGEDCAEFHVHGSQAVLDKLYHVLSTLGLRLAEPGEFSRRAVENGKLDLTQAEAIADLVEAESEAQRRQALSQLDGALGRRYEAWRLGLLDILARIEVYIDFPDEDLPTALIDTVRTRMTGLRDDLRAAVAEAGRGLQVRDGFRIVILGEPNAGKSSLFNALLKAEAAIVTPVAGTTRDVLEARLRIGGYTVMLYDTAGLRETDEPVEAEGIRRARAKADDADLRIWVVDSTRPNLPDVKPGDVVVLNKADLASRIADVSRETPAFRISLSTGEDLPELVAWLETEVTRRLASQTFPAATRQRHLDRLTAAADELDAALVSLMRVPELTAEHVRSALNAFEALFGRYDVENVLDIVFSSFCIGK